MRDPSDRGLSLCCLPKEMPLSDRLASASRSLCGLSETRNGRSLFDITRIATSTRPHNLLTVFERLCPSCGTVGCYCCAPLLFLHRPWVDPCYVQDGSRWVRREVFLIWPTVMHTTAHHRGMPSAESAAALGQFVGVRACRGSGCHEWICTEWKHHDLGCAGVLCCHRRSSNAASHSTPCVP